MLRVCDMRLMYHEAHFFLSFLSFLFFKKKRKKKLSVGPSVQPQHSHRSHISSLITQRRHSRRPVSVCACVCSFRELSEVREIEKKWEHAEFKREVGRKKERQSGKRRVEWERARRRVSEREWETSTERRRRERERERERGGELRLSRCTWQSSCGLLCCCCRGVAGRARRGTSPHWSPESHSLTCAVRSCHGFLNRIYCPNYSTGLSAAHQRPLHRQ